MEMNLEDEVESSKKLDEQRKKLHKELRVIEKCSCVPKEFQENLKSHLPATAAARGGAKEARPQGRTPESAERSKKIQSIQVKRRNLQKDSTAAEEEMRKLQEELKRIEERIFFCQQSR